MSFLKTLKKKVLEKETYIQELLCLFQNEKVTRFEFLTMTYVLLVLTPFSSSHYVLISSVRRNEGFLTV